MKALLFIAVSLLPCQEDPELVKRRDAVCVRIEETRGATFAKPVPVQEGSRKDFANLLLENAHELYGDDFKPFESTMKALGVIGRLLTLERAIPMAAVGKLQAYYGRGTVYVVDRAVPEDELVYKFTQGLVDQSGEWKTLMKALGNNFDALMALLSIRHGDSDMTKQLFWAGLKIDGKRPNADHLEKMIAGAVEWETQTPGFLPVSPLFTRPGRFMWQRGGIFMETMRQEGGLERLKKVYASPPASTEQILHPGKYLKGEAPGSIGMKPLEDYLASKAYTPLYQTTFGELGITIYLDAILKSTDLAVGAGWHGDRLLSWKDAKDAVVIAWIAAWDTEDDAKQFEAAAAKAIEAHGADANGQIVRKEKSTAYLLHFPKDLVAPALEATWKGSIK